MRTAHSWLAALHVSVALAGLVLAAAQESDVETRFREALGLLQADDAEAALALLEGILEQAENFPPAHFYAGMALGQLQRHGDAFAHFEAAGRLDPGNGDAHRMACISAFHTQDYDSSWAQCLLAAQAGVDVTQAFVELEQVSARPADLDTRLAAPRVLVLDVDLSGLGARDAQAGRNAAANTAIAEAGADFVEIRRQLSLAFQESPSFAVVKQEDLAVYLALIEADVFDAGLEGYCKLLDRSTGETAYSRRVQFRTIRQPGEIQRVIRRELAYLEDWLADQRQE